MLVLVAKGNYKMNKNELIQKLSLANRTYASGFPIMTDTEYDLLWSHLYAIDPHCPLLYHTANDPTLDINIEPHLHPIMGTQKAFDIDQLKPFLTRFGHTALILQPKYDGCAAVIYRQDNEKYKILLEGNGLSGRNITCHIENLLMIDTPRSMESVEIIIPMKDWKPSYGANPRNVVSGWMNRNETDFPPVRVIFHDKGPLNEIYNFDGDFDYLNELLLSLHYKWSQEYPIDGIMIKVKDEELRVRAGHNGSVSNWSIAWKPPIQVAETTVTKIEWNVSRQGRVVPTVIYAPIELCQTMNTKATGNNAQWITAKHLCIGSKIIVGKAGEIIPKILSCEDSVLPLRLPDNCPACDYPLEVVGKHLVCNGPECLSKIVSRLEFFYGDRAMFIKSIGRALYHKILQNPLIYRVLKDHIYALLEPEAFYIDAILEAEMGDVSYTNYKKALSKIYGKRSIIAFMSGLGYEGLGEKTATKLYHYINGAKLEQKVNSDVINSFAKAYAEYEKAVGIFKIFKFSAPPKPPLKRYCITGTVSIDRADMIRYLEKYQLGFTNTVLKHLDFLIVGDKPGRVKIEVAKRLGVPIITEEEIYKYINKE